MPSRVGSGNFVGSWIERRARIAPDDVALIAGIARPRMQNWPAGSGDWPRVSATWARDQIRLLDQRQQERAAAPPRTPARRLRSVRARARPKMEA